MVNWMVVGIPDAAAASKGSWHIAAGPAQSAAEIIDSPITSLYPCRG
jgi:hypothetical protein